MNANKSLKNSASNEFLREMEDILQTFQAEVREAKQVHEKEIREAMEELESGLEKHMPLAC